ncbi:helix-turn-helix transcriptional regulator [Thermoanaerobacter brockii subsp. lactiethylicus]|uniref:Transcriptional regulator, XRE family n=2 Tax=Thermoanaerobacter TaxID=1754 RepID=B0KAT5_THEP3|nr:MULTISPECIES: helix-turn-helix transcriptional regulator [Thermoanaerobacter]ABY93706.1 transcriptional regulator, XRE family [Thermoanaerobacter pseudethanolicus ATCC 33223]ADV78666.1 helix-turn-helix domain protein [Thermoanaerobacter brockii subsp. finnii Ako-1]HBW60409.1 XRE family transcriptional regulator [Thermoanaerobacter sp.]
MNKLKELRIKYKLTQKELAKNLGVTPDYISQIERGRIPGMETAIKIANFFNTTVDEIFLANNRTKSSQQ